MVAVPSSNSRLGTGNRWSQGGVGAIGGGLHSECLTNMNIEETIRDWAKSGRIARGVSVVRWSLCGFLLYIKTPKLKTQRAPRSLVNWYLFNQSNALCTQLL